MSTTAGSDLIYALRLLVEHISASDPVDGCETASDMLTGENTVL